MAKYTFGQNLKSFLGELNPFKDPVFKDPSFKEGAATATMLVPGTNVVAAGMANKIPILGKLGGAMQKLMKIGGPVVAGGNLAANYGMNTLNKAKAPATTPSSMNAPWFSSGVPKKMFNMPGEAGPGSPLMLYENIIPTLGFTARWPQGPTAPAATATPSASVHQGKAWTKKGPAPTLPATNLGNKLENMFATNLGTASGGSGISTIDPYAINKALASIKATATPTEALTRYQTLEKPSTGLE